MEVKLLVLFNFMGKVRNLLEILLLLGHSQVFNDIVCLFPVAPEIVLTLEEFQICIRLELRKSNELTRREFLIIFGKHRGLLTIGYTVLIFIFVFSNDVKPSQIALCSK